MYRSALESSAMEVNTIPFSKRVPLTGALCAAVMAGFALRCYNLGAQSFWEEELISLDLYAGKNLAQIIQFNVYAGDTQPPLYYVLLQAWVNVAGRSEFSVRFLSVVLSTLAIPVLYLFASRLFGRRVGFIAVTLAAANPFQIWYAQEARTYTLTLLLTLASTVCFLWTVSARKRTWPLAAYVVSTNLAILSHYFGFFIMAAQVTGLILWWLLWRAGGRRSTEPIWGEDFSASAKSVALAQILVFVPYLPWAPYAANVIGTFPGWREPLSPIEMFSISFQAFSLGTSIDGELARWLTLAFAFLAVAGIIASVINDQGGQDRELTSKQGMLFALVYFMLPFVGIALYLTYTGRTIFHERYFIITTPALFSITAYAVAYNGFYKSVRMPLPSIIVSVFLALVILSVSALSLYNYYHLPNYHKPDVRSAMGYVESAGESGDVIVTTRASGKLMIDHYRPPNVPTYLLSEGKPFDKIAVESELRNLLRKYKRIWLLPFAGGDVDPWVEGWLDEHAFRTFHRWYAKGRMLLYIVGTDLPNPTEARVFNFANTIEASSVRFPTALAQAGTVVPVLIEWRPLRSYNVGLTVALDLVDQEKEQHTRQLQPIPPPEKQFPELTGEDGKAVGLVSQRLGLQIPFGTPPGKYTIEARVIPTGSMQELEVIDDEGRWKGTKAEIGSIQVEARPNTPVSALDVPTRIDANLTNEVRLIGHDLAEVSLNVGQSFSRKLYWQAIERINRDIQPVIEMKSSEGAVVARYAAPPAGGRHPMREWVRGEVVRDIRTLAVPREVASGWHSLSLHLEEADGRKAGSEITLGKINVVARTRNWTVPAMTRTTNAQFGSLARLLGYDLEVGEEPAEKGYLYVTLHWQAVGETPENYKTFVHLLDSQGSIISQSDGFPGSGSAPTSGWITGEIVTDRHRILLSTSMAEVSGLRIGIYNPVTLSRLPASVDGLPAPDNAPVFKLSGQRR